MMTMMFDDDEKKYMDSHEQKHQDEYNGCERESSSIVPPPRHPLGYETTILKHRRHFGAEFHEEGMDCWREPKMSTAFQRHLEYRRAKPAQVASQIFHKIRSLVSQIISSSSSSLSLWRGFRKNPGPCVWYLCFFAILGALRLPQGGAVYSPAKHPARSIGASDNTGSVQPMMMMTQNAEALEKQQHPHGNDYKATSSSYVAELHKLRESIDEINLRLDNLSWGTPSHKTGAAAALQTNGCHLPLFIEEDHNIVEGHDDDSNEDIEDDVSAVQSWRRGSTI